jgi:Transposase DDE domain
VRNWAEYDRGLVRRGDIRVWLSEDAVAGWRASVRATPGEQHRFSNLAIETSLILGAVMRLPLRQTEGFVRSLMAMIKLDLAVPDHTTQARRRRTVDIREQRWQRADPIDIVIDSTGLEFFDPGERRTARRQQARAPCHGNCGSRTNGLAAATRIRQTLTGRDSHLPHQEDQRRTPDLPNLRSPAERSRHSSQDRQPQHHARKTNLRAHALKASQSHRHTDWHPCTKPALFYLACLLRHSCIHRHHSSRQTQHSLMI